MRSRFIVTGGAGFIGSALVRHLVRDLNATVLVVDKLTYAGVPESLKEAGVWMTGLDWGEDARRYDKIDFKGRVGLVVGAEGSGITRLVRSTCDFIAELPMPGGFESLNAGGAAAVTMYEILRPRG